MGKKNKLCKELLLKAGRYGGTYAHKDIAFEFASWISPQFKLYLIKNFSALKTKKKNSLVGILEEILQKLIIAFTLMQ